MVSRIKGITPKITHITTCWDDCVVAARVEVGDRLVYLVRSNEAGWKVTEVGIRYP